MFSCSTGPVLTVRKQSWAWCFCMASCYRETGRRFFPPFPSRAVRGDRHGIHPLYGRVLPSSCIPSSFRSFKMHLFRFISLQVLLRREWSLHVHQETEAQTEKASCFCRYRAGGCQWQDQDYVFVQQLFRPSRRNTQSRLDSTGTAEDTKSKHV